MDNFSVDSGSVQEVERATQGIGQELRDQIRDVEKLISLQPQLIGSARGIRRTAAAVDNDLSLQPLYSSDPFALQPSSKADKHKVDQLLDQAVRRRIDAEVAQAKAAQANVVDWNLRTQLFGNTPIPNKGKTVPAEYELSRHDVRNFRGLLRLAMGDIDFHTVKESIGAFGHLGFQGAGKLAETMSAASGPAFFLQMVGQVASRIFEERTQDLQRVSSTFLQVAASAEKAGVDIETEKDVRRQAFGRALKKRAKEMSHRKITGIGFLDEAWNKIDLATEYFVHGDEKLKAEANADAAEAITLIERATASPEFMRKQGLIGLGSSFDSKERMQFIDGIVAQRLQEAKRFFADEDERRRLKREADLPIERDKLSNPLLASQLRNTEALLKKTEERMHMQKQDWNKE